MIDDDNILESLIANTLNPESKNIDHDKLERFLLKFVDKMKRDNKPIDNDMKIIIGICCKLWREKESWKDMYYGLYERYSKHLDTEIAEYERMLGNHTRRVLNHDKEK